MNKMELVLRDLESMKSVEEKLLHDVRKLTDGCHARVRLGEDTYNALKREEEISRRTISVLKEALMRVEIIDKGDC